MIGREKHKKLFLTLIRKERFKMRNIIFIAIFLLVAVCFTSESFAKNPVTTQLEQHDTDIKEDIAQHDTNVNDDLATINSNLLLHDTAVNDSLTNVIDPKLDELLATGGYGGATPQLGQVKCGDTVTYSVFKKLPQPVAFVPIPQIGHFSKTGSSKGCFHSSP